LRISKIKVEKSEHKATSTVTHLHMSIISFAWFQQIN